MVLAAGIRLGTGSGASRLLVNADFRDPPIFRISRDIIVNPLRRTPPTCARGCQTNRMRRTWSSDREVRHFIARSRFVLTSANAETFSTSALAPSAYRLTAISGNAQEGAGPLLLRPISRPAIGDAASFPPPGATVA
jgi:hypothetical protein